MADEPEKDGQPEDVSGDTGKSNPAPGLSLGAGRPSLRNIPHKKAEPKEPVPTEEKKPDGEHRGESGESTQQDGNDEGNSIAGEDVDPHHDHDHDHDPYHHDDYHDHDHDYDDYHHDHDDDPHHHEPEDDWWEEDEKDEDDELPPEGEMSLLDHLEELRWTIFKSMAALVVGCVVVGVNVRFFADILQQPIEYAVNSSAGRVHFVTDEYKLHSKNATNGKVAWVYPPEGQDGKVLARPILGDRKSKSLYTVVDNSVVALNRKKGDELWKFTPPAGQLEPDSLRVGDEESLFISAVGGVSDTGGAVYAVNAKNGKKIWDVSTNEKLAFAPVPDVADEQIDLRTRQPLGVMMVLMQVVFFGGLAISLPFIVMFASGFVAPGLTKREKRMLLPGSIGAVVLFLMGAALAFFFIVPVSLKFSVVLNDWLGIELLWDVNDFYSLVVMVTLAVGALFQFPLLLVILGYLGVLSAQKLRGARQVVFVIILVIAALLTPGDVIVALILLTIPLYALFEGSILMVAYVERAKAKKQARIEARRKKREEARKQARVDAEEALKNVEPGEQDGEESGKPPESDGGSKGKE